MELHIEEGSAYSESAKRLVNHVTTIDMYISEIICILKGSITKKKI